MNKPYKILQAVGSLDRGGVETWLLHIARNIDRSRFHIDILVDSSKEYAYNDDFRAEGYRILPCPRNWRYAATFWSLCRTNGPYDILHSHMNSFGGILLALAKTQGTPVRIVHTHPVGDPLGDTQRLSAKRSAERRLGFALTRWGATHLLTPSEATMRAYVEASGFRSENRSIVYNAVDLPKFDRPVDRCETRRELGIPEDLPLITYVARFWPHKNHRQVLRVADKLKSQGLKVHFALAGSHGPLLDSLKSQRRDDISLLVGLKDVSKLLLASDAFFFPSLEEGFGIVAIEAAAAGLSVVASRLESISEALAPSHRKLTFEPDNDEEATAQLKLVLSDSNLRSQLSADGKAWAKRFSIESSVQSLTEIYEKAMGLSATKVKK